jgi:hypothetical protein
VCAASIFGCFLFSPISGGLRLFVLTECSSLKSEVTTTAPHGGEAVPLRKPPSLGPKGLWYEPSPPGPALERQLLDLGVDLPLMVLVYRGKAENRTFGPPETNKQKKPI